MRVASSGETWAAASNRWVREDRRVETDTFRKQVRDECLARGLSRTEARQHSWEATIAAFPPLGQPTVEPAAVEPAADPLPLESPAQEPAGRDLPASSTTGNLKGLGDIPEAWGTLPSNSSLPTEIGWVQANRLLVVEERPSGATVVHLERSLSPAPSHAALGWLETSIRSYAKYVDVVARALAAVQDEQENVTGERMRLDDIKQLLTEAMQHRV